MDIKLESNNENEESLDDECYSAVFESDPENIDEESGDVEDYEVFLERDMEVTTETTNVRMEETVLKLDKATQTYEHEFPEMMISAGPLAPIIISSLNTLSNAITPVFSEKFLNNSSVNIKEITEGSLDDSVCSNATTVDTKEHILTSQSTLNLINNTSNVLNENNKDINAKNLRTNSSNSKAIDIKQNHERNTASASTVKNTQRYNNSQNSEKRTWRQPRTYQNHRAHPYHNNFYNNPPQNYYNGYHNNYYNYYDHRQGWQVHNYNHQFKERLFHGFVRFMDYVFPNNFANDEY